MLFNLWVCFLPSGWQPRWFVLENGVISYYDSEDDVGKGSKGSIKMSVCDIKGQTAVYNAWLMASTVLTLGAIKVNTDHIFYFSSSDRYDTSRVDNPRWAAFLRASCERCRETEVAGGFRLVQSWNSGQSQTQRYLLKDSLARDFS